MKFNNRSFPYPVLGNTDDVIGNFYADINYKITKEDLLIYLKFVLDNETLSYLISLDKASFVVHLECSATFFRESYKFKNQEGKIGPLKTELLRDDLDINLFICANEDLNEYKIKGSHNYFKGFSFNVEKGSILAYGGKTNILVTKDYDALKYVSSIMAIDEGDYEEGSMQANFQLPKKIMVTLSKPDYKLYSNYKENQNVSGVFHSAIVLPVLMEALKLVKDGDNFMLEEMLWFKILKKRLEDLQIPEDDNNYLEIAQKILENPLSRSMTSIDYFTKELTNADYE